MKQSFGFIDRQIIDARIAVHHEPLFVAVRAKPFFVDILAFDAGRMLPLNGLADYVKRNHNGARFSPKRTPCLYRLCMSAGSPPADVLIASNDRDWSTAGKLHRHASDGSGLGCCLMQCIIELAQCAMNGRSAILDNPRGE